MSEPDFTFRGLLVRSFEEEGLTREAAEAAADAILPPPPDESTLKGWIRARILEAQANLLVYGQHPPPPPEERAQPRGIEGLGVWVDEVIDLPPEACSIATPDEAAIEDVIHNPLWNLGRTPLG